jgi:hypothetical protein
VGSSSATYGYTFNLCNIFNLDPLGLDFWALPNFAGIHAAQFGERGQNPAGKTALAAVHASLSL